MKILKSNQPHKEYLNFVRELYDKSDATDKYIINIKNGLDFVLQKENIQTAFFSIIRNSNLVGHLGIIKYSMDEAFFGFFEMADKNDFEELWESVITEAAGMGITTIFGPVNGSVWHSYRVISETNKEPFFLNEPITSLEYYQLFCNSNPSKKINYYSAYRTNYETILNVTSSSVASSCKQGIEIKQEEASVKLIQKLYNLSTEVFSHNPGYIPLSFEDFMKLYNLDNSKTIKALIYTAFHNGKLIGFSYNILSKKDLIMKTIGVTPEMQEQGIGNALVNFVHSYAAKNNVSKVIYALVRNDNKVQFFPKDKVTVFRRYAAFKFTLS
jgi:ribosomal protein S18 acetylase RimI-like enzyme